jgi:hypothetical protein
MSCPSILSWILAANHSQIPILPNLSPPHFPPMKFRESMKRDGNNDNQVEFNHKLILSLELKLCCLASVNAEFEKQNRKPN